MRPQTFDKERLSLNLARLKKGGEVFEIIIDPEKVIEYKKSKKVPVREVLKYEKIFSDAKKGFEASEQHMKSIFQTTEEIDIAKRILDEGEIQFTQEYREQKRKEKRNKILDLISRNAIDPKTGIPHPRTRIENAMEEANIKIDYFKDAQEQVKDIVKSMQPILPIKLAVKQIQIKVPAEHGAKAYSSVDRMGKIIQDDWQSDGSWLCVVEIPAGLQNEFFDMINKLTHGEVESKVINER